MDTIILCGGGTLGHCMPNIAIYEKLKDEYNFIYIGTKNGIEKNIAKQFMLYKEIESAKLIRKFTFKNLLIPFKVYKGIREAKHILKETKPKLVFCKGGYASIPVCIASKRLNIPCITHESDFSIGLANKIISKKCEAVCTSFEETSTKVKNGIFTGSPIRRQIFCGKSEKIAEKLHFESKKTTILVVGGSLGSETINKNIRLCLQDLKDFNIIHITGKNKIDNSVRYENYRQIEFVNDIENYYANADIVITRGGSNTLFELLALKKTILVIPLPKGISRGDQEENARHLHTLNLVNILEEKDLTPTTLKEKILETHKNNKAIIQSIKNIQIDGTDKICNIIKSTIKKNSKI